MATPAIGTIVLYHEYGGTAPAIVAADTASWSSAIYGDNGYSGQPSAGTVLLLVFDGSSGANFYSNVAEGTSDGQYSLIA